ncbi:MAG: TatD family hydrolase [Planctomycetaceae bacterium]|nr:TatD family hydrolase [Planctomycetaceae bacterium]
MNQGYVDTHCHLESHKFEKDSVEVARRSLAAGVRMLTVAADLPSAYRSVLLAEQVPGVRAAVGVHPTEAGTLDDVAWSEIEHLATAPRVVAIGETGLDYYWKDCPPETQKGWFVKHIELAKALGKPLSIHARDSVADTLAMLEPHFADGLKGIWHCFVAGRKEIGPALDFAAKHGLFLGIGGLVTFEDQKPLREIVPSIPPELLLLETDAPYLVPRPKTMDRNEPVGVIRVAEVLAELRGTDPEAIREVTTANAEGLLGEFRP